MYKGILSKYTGILCKYKSILSKYKYTCKLHKYTFKEQKFTLEIHKYTVEKKPKNKVVESAIWFNWFTCTVWGLCWYHFVSLHLLHFITTLCIFMFDALGDPIAASGSRRRMWAPLVRQLDWMVLRLFCCVLIFGPACNEEPRAWCFE